MPWNIASHSEFHGKSLQTKTTTRSEFPNGVKAVVKKNTSIRRNKQIKKSTMVRVTVGIWVGKLINWVRSFEVEKL